MSATTTAVAAADVTEIPAALPAVESEDEREKLINQFAANEETKSETRDLSAETSEEEDDADEIVGIPKASKKKLFLAFVGFVACFVLLLAALCWFFGIGVFAAAKSQTVDRTRKNDSSNLNAPLTEDEKLKNALNIVAEKNADKQSDTLSETNSLSTSADSSQTIPSEKSADLNQPVVVPDLPTKRNYDAANVSMNSVGANSNNAPTESVSNPVENSPGKNQTNPLLAVKSEQNGEITPMGRSLFFGIKQNEKTNVAAALVSANNQAATKIENTNFASTDAVIPFGTLLPIRFLGAVYTLRASGGLVRMELTRSVTGKNYSYPAGTILVGTLRGSEFKRAFVSVVGLIDPKTRGLMKIEGEVMGGDGASGVLGKRRKVNGAWSRTLAGLREAGTTALGALGNLRSGSGTVILSDSTRRASGAISEELSGLTGGQSNRGEFVEITAGTNAYVLITDLPDEISSLPVALRQNQKSATGLSDDELADLFSEGSTEKIRAALPRMSPRFRKLAEQTLAAMKGE